MFLRAADFWRALAILLSSGGLNLPAFSRGICLIRGAISPHRGAGSSGNRRTRPSFLERRAGLAGDIPIHAEHAVAHPVAVGPALQVLDHLRGAGLPLL